MLNYVKGSHVEESHVKESDLERKRAKKSHANESHAEKHTSKNHTPKNALARVVLRASGDDMRLACRLRGASACVLVHLLCDACAGQSKGSSLEIVR